MAKAAYHHGELRQALLEAAEAELSEKGVEGFSLRGAAKRAGVSHAAPAHHFKDTNAMLTALAAVAFERFALSMRARQQHAAKDARSQFVACGLGYIDFAISSPALFKLMFGSDRPDRADPGLSRNGAAAFAVLVEAIAAVRGINPLDSRLGQLDIAASWAIVHGIANLMIARRVPFMQQLFDQDRDAGLAAIIGRALPDDASKELPIR